MKNRIKIEKLKLQSFVTKMSKDRKDTIAGGAYSCTPGCNYNTLKCGDTSDTYANTYEDCVTR